MTPSGRILAASAAAAVVGVLTIGVVAATGAGTATGGQSFNARYPNTIDRCALISAAKVSSATGSEMEEPVKGQTSGGQPVCTYTAIGDKSNWVNIRVLPASEFDQARYGFITWPTEGLTGNWDQGYLYSGDGGGTVIFKKGGTAIQVNSASCVAREDCGAVTIARSIAGRLRVGPVVSDDNSSTTGITEYCDPRYRQGLPPCPD